MSDTTTTRKDTTMNTTTDRQPMIDHDDALGRLMETAARTAQFADYLNSTDPWGKPRCRDEKQIAKANADAVDAHNALIVHEANYTGWARFYLVTSSNNGHIHRTMACSTCHYTTRFALLPTLSGTDEATAVAEQGEILCSVCFPDAPVEWTNGVSKATVAEREAKAAAKAEREAKKIAKRLIADDPKGYRTTGHYSERIETVAAAKSFLTNGYDWGWDHGSYVSADRDAVAALLVGRPGVKETTVDEILAAAAKRAARRG